MRFYSKVQREVEVGSGAGGRRVRSLSSGGCNRGGCLREGGAVEASESTAYAVREQRVEKHGRKWKVGRRRRRRYLGGSGCGGCGGGWWRWRLTGGCCCCSSCGSFLLVGVLMAAERLRGGEPAGAVGAREGPLSGSDGRGRDVDAAEEVVVACAVRLRHLISLIRLVKRSSCRRRQAGY